MYSSLYPSPIGTLLITANDTAITGVSLVNDENLLADDSENAVIKQAKVWLGHYFNCENPAYMPNLEFKGTPFQMRVWQELISIPYGKTCSYGDIAEKVFGSRKGCQSIGQAISKNPILILVPCHRVIGSNGKLTGFASGVEIKKKLLEHELI